MNEYDYNQTVNPPQLIDEIATASLPAPDSVSTNQVTFGTPAVQIFYNTALSSDQQASLSTVVANHVANFSYVTLAVQAQLSTLISYINNSDTNTSNIARAVIIANICSSLPLSLLTTINNQIAQELSNG